MLWLRWRRWPSPQSVPKGRVTTRASTKALEATVFHRSQSALLDFGPVHILGDNTTPPGDIDLKSGIGRPPSPPPVAPSQMHENTATDSTGHPCARTAIEAGQSVNSTSLQGVSAWKSHCELAGAHMERYAAQSAVHPAWPRATTLPLTGAAPSAALSARSPGPVFMSVLPSVFSSADACYHTCHIPIPFT